MGHYDYEPSEADIAYANRQDQQKYRNLEAALYDVRKLSCWSPDKNWSIAEIRCIDLFTAIEDRIKSQLYDLRDCV